MRDMARFLCFTQFFLVCFAALFLAAESGPIQAAPRSHTFAGVFMLTEGGAYTLNFTAARAACLSLDVTIATEDQMLRALERGLETCKFGWIAEQIVVVPRLTSDSKCGKGGIGVVPWRRSPNMKFGVFCFNASELVETSNTSKAAPQSSTPPTTPTAASTPATTPLVTSTTTKAVSSVKPMTAKSPHTTSSPASALLIKTTRSTSISSTSTSLKAFSTRVPPSLSDLITLKPTIVTVAFSTSVSVLPPSLGPANPSLGALPTALIILGVILLLLTAAGAVWYFKPNIFTFWSPGQQKDDTETEMWKHTDSEMELHS